MLFTGNYVKATDADAATSVAGDDGTLNPADPTLPTPEKITKEDIQKYFTLKRRQHLEAVETLLKFPRYEQKYNMLQRLYEKIFEVIEGSRVKVADSQYLQGESGSVNGVPGKEAIVDVLYILDNCAFFGNLVLKLPDMTERLLKGTPTWVDSYKWCFNFSTATNLIDDYSLKMFNLSAQQLGLMPRDADFVNPYEKKTARGARKAKKTTDVPSKKVKDQPTKLNRGPRMSKVEL